MGKHLVGDVPNVICPYCGEDKLQMLHWTHLKKHGKKLEDVIREFPNHITMTKEEYERKCQISKKGTEASIKTQSQMKTVYCVYFNDKNCSKESIEVPKNYPNNWVCDKCRSLGKEEVDGRRIEKANIERKKTLQEKYGKNVTNPQHISSVNKKMVQTQREKYGGVGYERSDLSKK